MFDRLEISVLPRDRRFPPSLRILVNGEDVVAGAVGDGGRGPLVADVLPAGGGPWLLWATGEARRVELGEPECSRGCCGFLTVVVQRFGGIVQWSDWQVPYEEVAPPEFHFGAERYDAELARVDAGTGRLGAS
ncbi:hypothetical protein ACFWM7_29010 [Streptomyces sp. NPDC058375]|uniref:hypothetical protein n=1 Tax=Streptomyces sp. NPDC058375 TaxID=3346467 RepID=UPI0036543B26